MGFRVGRETAVRDCLTGKAGGIGSLRKGGAEGFTIVELLVSIAVFGIIFGIIYSTFIMQRRYFSMQEEITQMQQNVRAAMDMIVREVSLAGYDPTDAGFYGITYSTSQLQIKADLNGDGDVDDSNENIIYTYDSANYQIDRNTGGGNQPFAEDIEAFNFSYLDSDGNATTSSSDIRQVQLTITGRTSKPNPDYPDNNGYRTYTLTTLVTPRNLSF